MSVNVNATFTDNQNFGASFSGDQNMSASFDANIMVVPFADSLPLMDGEADAGEATTCARADHVHPSDSSKADVADLAAVATSGSYNDLKDKPTIPVVPTAVSSFTNDAGYLTAESDPSVPSWAKQPDKPTYTAAEVGAVPITRNVNNKALSADITLGASDVGAYAKPNGGIPKSDLVTAVRTSLDKADSAYQKPSGGIPKTDLASDVQTSLGKADTALQAHQSLSGYATEAWVGQQGFGTYSKPSGGIPASDMTSEVQTSLGKADSALQQHQDISGKLDTTGDAFRTVSIPWGKVDSTSTSTVYTATVPGITELRDGVCVMLMNGVVTSASGFTININNLGARPVYSTLSAASRATTLFNIGYTLFLVYNTHRDPTNFPDGVWDCYYGYDSNTNTIGYQLRTNSLSLPMDSVTYRYRLLFTSPDGTKWIPANNSTSTNATAKRNTIQTPIDPFGRIAYYGTTASVAAGSRPAVANLWTQYVVTLGYSFNRTGAALVLTSWKPVYIKCEPQTDGSAIIDAETPYVQTLPSTADGNIYIHLGIAVSATTVEVTQEHPVYCYRNGAVRKWTGLEAELDALIARIEALET